LSLISLSPNASGTGVFTVASPNSNVDRVLTLPDESGTVITTATTLVPSTTNTSITLGTAVATTSGTSIDFTGIPAGVKRVTVNFDNVSLSATAAILIQLGDSGGVKTTAYEGNSQTLSSITTTTSYASGFGLNTGGNAGNRHHGVVTLSLVNAATFVWASVGCVTLGNNTISAATAGIVTLSAVINRVRITSTSTDTFDLGSVNISWEF